MCFVNKFKPGDILTRLTDIDGSFTKYITGSNDKLYFYVYCGTTHDSTDVERMQILIIENNHELSTNFFQLENE